MSSTSHEYSLSYDGGNMDVIAGRVSLLDLGNSALRIVEGPEHGHATVNPDGNVALVLTDPAWTGDLSLKVEVDGPGGPRTVDVSLTAQLGFENGGWGDGNHYTLQDDADGKTIVEVGENHRKVYVSGDSEALSRADIAQMEGLSTSQITDAWLVKHPEYGGSEDMALDAQTAGGLWRSITGSGSEPASHWLLFERGHTYGSEFGRIIPSGSEGESELHPLMLGAWGSGEPPVIDHGLRIYQESGKNIVVRDVELSEGVLLLKSENILFDNVIVSDDDFVAQGGDRLTLRNSQIIDVHQDVSATSGYWGTSQNKTGGIFATKVDGVLIENTFFDHNGWEDDYRYDLSLEGGQPPSKFSHNVYIQYDVTDVTFRDNISMQGASFGAQIRSGGVVEDNVFVDNNAAVRVGWAGNEGQYSLVRDNIVTLGAHKDAQDLNGALTMGMEIEDYLVSVIDNIVAHLSDPDDAEGLAEKEQSHTPFRLAHEAFTNNTIVYNWVTENLRDAPWKQVNRNVPDIPEAELNEVTISNYLAEMLNRAVSGDGVELLSDWLRANWNDLEAAADIVAYFQEGFGIPQPLPHGPIIQRFAPDPRADGVRWDVGINWWDDERPRDGDGADLAGNWVNYGGSTSLSSLELGTGGFLTVGQGYLSVDTLLSSADAGLQIVRSGQFWVDAYQGDETLSVTLDAGRFANTGAFEGAVDIVVSGGEFLFAADGGRFVLDGALRVEGSAARLGFDGASNAAGALVLGDGARVELVADAAGISTLGEFRSGHWGVEGPRITSTLDLGDGGATLSLDLGAYTSAGVLSLAEADQILGGFGAVEIAGVDPARVTLTLDLASDTLDLGIASSQGGGLPHLLISGSSAADLFVVAEGVKTTLNEYGAGDVVDLTSVLTPGQLNSLRLADTANGVAIVAGSTVIAQIADSNVDEVRIRFNDKETWLSASGILDDVIPGAGEAELPDTPGEGTVVMAINSFGTAFNNSDDIDYVADTDVSGGRKYTTTAEIAGTADDSLYQTERWGDFSYDLALENGRYEVTFQFAEIYHNAAGHRLFDVEAEGRVVLNDVDIWTEAGGKNIAWDVTVSVVVLDGNLDLDFIGVKDNAKLSGLIVTSVSSDELPDSGSAPFDLSGQSLEMEDVFLFGFGMDGEQAELARGPNGIGVRDIGGDFYIDSRRGPDGGSEKVGVVFKEGASEVALAFDNVGYRQGAQEAVIFRTYDASGAELENHLLTADILGPDDAITLTLGAKAHYATIEASAWVTDGEVSFWHEPDFGLISIDVLDLIA